MLIGALVLTALSIVIGIARRIDVTPRALWLCAAGAVLLALSAGGPRWEARARREVVVMVDLSPSTRGAAYRDRATLERRVRQLVGDVPHRIVAFSEGNHELPRDASLPD